MVPKAFSLIVEFNIKGMRIKTKAPKKIIILIFSIIFFN